MIYSSPLYQAVRLFRDELVGRPDFGCAKIGFTGSREGPTREQKTVWGNLAPWLKGIEMHNGCADGADAYVMGNLPIPASLVAWPANREGDARAKALLGVTIVIMGIMPPLERNRFIVDSSHGMVAMPITVEEVQRSGTWATIRHARRTKKPVLVIRPDGLLSFDGSLADTGL